MAILLLHNSHLLSLVALLFSLHHVLLAKYVGRPVIRPLIASIEWIIHIKAGILHHN